MFFSKKWKRIYSEELRLHSNFTNSDFLKKLAKDNNLNLKINYISNRFNSIRKLFGNYFSGEVIGTFRYKKLLFNQRKI